MREKNMQNTYCNPLVLPDYPCLAVKSASPAPPGEGGLWKRAGKKFVTEFDFSRAIDPKMLPFDPEQGFPEEEDHYTRETENDVRATADPSVLYYQGRWYLYCTGGYVYDTEDFIHWTPHIDETFRAISTPMAPTAAVIGGKFYATANSVPLHVSDSPLGPWTAVGEWTLPDGREMLANDPMIFVDDDGRAYLYFGLGSAIYGAELDTARPNHLLTSPKLLCTFNGENAWERMGARNENWHSGSIEGSWMYKRSGTYYLLYSVCGTEYNTYCMGAYVGKSPLGDFALQKRNPVSRSDSGLVRGGGHGCVVDGPGDTIWCFYTIPVGIDHIFERRIGMDPCGIDEDGCLYAKTGCDTPQYAPGVLESPEAGNETGLVPCTFFSLTAASSYAPGHRPLYALDETLHTWWQPAKGDAAPCLAVSLRGDYFIRALRLIWKDVGLDFAAGVYPGPYRYVVEAKVGREWVTLVDESENETDLTVDYRTFDEVLASAVRVRISSAPKGLVPGIISFTVFGESADRRLRWGHAPLELDS